MPWVTSLQDPHANSGRGAGAEGRVRRESAGGAASRDWAPQKCPTVPGNRSSLLPMGMKNKDKTPWTLESSQQTQKFVETYLNNKQTKLPQACKSLSPGKGAVFPLCTCQDWPRQRAQWRPATTVTMRRPPKGSHWMTGLEAWGAMALVNRAEQVKYWEV